MEVFEGAATEQTSCQKDSINEQVEPCSLRQILRTVDSKGIWRSSGAEVDLGQKTSAARAVLLRRLQPIKSRNLSNNVLTNKHPSPAESGRPLLSRAPLGQPAGDEEGA
jgi:hypothetical protein